MVKFSANLAASLLFASVLSTGASAAAEQCTLKLMAALPMTNRAGAFTVPVSLNGDSHQFIVDTGGIYTSVAENVVRQQQLKEVPISGTELYDAKGNRFKNGVVVDSLKLGNNEVKHIHMFVHDGLDVDGTIAPNLLQVFDVELDFANGKMNLFSPDHCPGKVVYWAKDYAAIPFKTPDGFHIVVPVTLDGHTLEANFDTGASVTLISQRAAQALFNVGVVHAGSNQGAEAGQDQSQHLHQFQSLSFNGVDVKNPQIYALPDDAENAIRKDYDDPKSINDPVYGLQLGLPRLTIGEDVIRRLHVYIAYKEEVMYVTSVDAH
ncbi:MAG TPA: pepsin/retropepsin-like aspartic protease family protein [Rhizomicrobium sp.]